MATPPTKVFEAIQEYFRTEYGGSGDPEIFDSVDFCQYFARKYPDGPAQNGLKQMFVELQSVVQRLSGGWVPVREIGVVVAECAEDNPEFFIAPWQAGLTENHSVKGQSKQVHVLATAKRFLMNPYNSRADPVKILFPPGALVGSATQDWSFIMDVGMGKNSAIRMILEAVSCLRTSGVITEDDLGPLLAQLRAMFRCRCLYDPADGDQEAQLKKSMYSKQVAAERTRPDPLQWASRWEKIICSTGAHYASTIAGKIERHNLNPDEAAKFNEVETAFMLLYPHLSAEAMQFTIAAPRPPVAVGESSSSKGMGSLRAATLRMVHLP